MNMSDYHSDDAAEEVGVVNVETEVDREDVAGNDDVEDSAEDSAQQELLRNSTRVEMPSVPLET